MAIINTKLLSRILPLLKYRTCLVAEKDTEYHLEFPNNNGWLVMVIYDDQWSGIKIRDGYKTNFYFYQVEEIEEACRDFNRFCERNMGLKR